MRAVNHVQQPTSLVEIPERKGSRERSSRKDRLVVCSIEILSMASAMESQEKRRTHPERDCADAGVHPDSKQLLVHPQVDHTHNAIERSNCDDVDSRSAAQTGDGRGGGRLEGVDEGAGSDVVEGEGTLTGGEENLVQVGRRVKEVGGREGGRKRDGRGEL